MDNHYFYGHFQVRKLLVITRPGISTSSPSSASHHLTKIVGSWAPRIEGWSNSSCRYGNFYIVNMVIGWLYWLWEWLGPNNYLQLANNYLQLDNMVGYWL